MNFPESIKAGFVNYVNFNGRSSRSEYWYWVLFYLIVILCASILDTSLFPESETAPFSAICSLVFALPGLSVGVRRLHDLDKTGWWILISFIPLIGAIVLLIWFVRAGAPEGNRFGPSPLFPSAPPFP